MVLNIPSIVNSSQIKVLLWKKNNHFETSQQYRFNMLSKFFLNLEI